jgi:hypothetical protein
MARELKVSNAYYFVILDIFFCLRVLFANGVSEEIVYPIPKELVTLNISLGNKITKEVKSKMIYSNSVNGYYGEISNLSGFFNNIEVYLKNDKVEKVFLLGNMRLDNESISKLNNLSKTCSVLFGDTELVEEYATISHLDDNRNVITINNMISKNWNIQNRFSIRYFFISSQGIDNIKEYYQQNVIVPYGIIIELLGQ